MRFLSEVNIDNKWLTVLHLLFQETSGGSNNMIHCKLLMCVSMYSPAVRHGTESAF